MESIGELWKWLIGLGTGIIGVLSFRTLRQYDKEIDGMRLKIHAANETIHKLGLEMERLKAEVEHIRKGRR